VILHVARLTELDPVTLYNLLRLRTDVFVVEQHCPYPELDGLDLAETTRHLWFAPPDDEANPQAYARLLQENDPDKPDADWIGRVCTAATARGAGLAGRLMEAAIGLARPDVPIRLNAQAHLSDYYGRFGFELDGPEFLDDGIPHVPMLRKP
jgi:ElaA protein